MKSIIYAKRTFKELIRDPFSIIFGIVLPIVLLLLMNTIQRNAQVNIFELENFTPGIAVFSFSFITLFSSTLIAKDRTSSFLNRLYSSPLKSYDYILGYSLPLIPIAFLQSIICYSTAILLGMNFSINIIYSIILLIPVSFLFIGFGLLLGSLFTDKQSAPISSIIVQIVALSSGMWFDLNLVGGIVEKISKILPFYHCVNLAKASLINNSSLIFTNLIWVVIYTILIFIIAIIIFKKNMKK